MYVYARHFIYDPHLFREYTAPRGRGKHYLDLMLYHPLLFFPFFSAFQPLQSFISFPLLNFLFSPIMTIA